MNRKLARQVQNSERKSPTPNGCAQISKEEELHMNKNRKHVDIREEYFVRAHSLVSQSWLS